MTVEYFFHATEVFSDDDHRQRFGDSSGIVLVVKQVHLDHERLAGDQLHAARRVRDGQVRLVRRESDAPDRNLQETMRLCDLPIADLDREHPADGVRHVDLFPDVVDQEVRDLVVRLETVGFLVTGQRSLLFEDS